MSLKYVKVEKRDHITFVTINRPEVMNALHAEANQELGQAMNEFRDDADAWVAVMTGEGERAFSAGNDLKATAAGTGKLQDTSKIGGFGGMASRTDLFKPVIAAVNGVALGGGFEIALACDIILASENALFGLPEPRVGLAALAGGIHRLPRVIPYHMAMTMMMTGKPVSAAEAHRLGLVSEVVPQADLLAKAEEYARTIIECAPLSIQYTKQSAKMGLHMSIEEAMAMKVPLHESFYNSSDFIEGPKAFAEKRKPNWKGK